jgi:hypothetical protein
MARVFSYQDLAQDRPAPAADVVRIANEISSLPAFRSGHAVLIGSAAWGDASWRSDIDVVAYGSSDTKQLDADIQELLAIYEKSSRHAAPKADVILIGAEHEDLIERDNLVSGSVPILEPVVVSEMFDRVCARLGDHIRALARTKGNPWESFAKKYLKRWKAHGSIVLDLIGEYSAAIASGWREYDWLTEETPLIDEKLVQLGYADGFAIHLSRLVLSHQHAYPIPDRRADVRTALSKVGTWGTRFGSVLAPFFDFGDHYEHLAARIRRNEAVTQIEFDRVLSMAAARIDFSPVEELTWSYRAQNPPRRRG